MIKLTDHENRQDVVVKHTLCIPKSKTVRVNSLLLVMLVESLSCFHTQFPLPHQLVHALQWLEEGVLWISSMPTCINKGVGDN